MIGVPVEVQVEGGWWVKATPTAATDVAEMHVYAAARPDSHWQFGSWWLRCHSQVHAQSVLTRVQRGFACDARLWRT